LNSVARAVGATGNRGPSGFDFVADLEPGQVTQVNELDFRNCRDINFRTIDDGEGDDRIGAGIVTGADDADLTKGIGFDAVIGGHLRVQISSDFLCQGQQLRNAVVEQTIRRRCQTRDVIQIERCRKLVSCLDVQLDLIRRMYLTVELELVNRSNRRIRAVERYKRYIINLAETNDATNGLDHPAGLNQVALRAKLGVDQISKLLGDLFNRRIRVGCYLELFIRFDRAIAVKIDADGEGIAFFQICCGNGDVHVAGLTAIVADEHVGARRTGIQEIVALATDQKVVTLATVEAVIVIIAADDIVTGAATEIVLTGATKDDVVFRTAVGIVVAGAALDEVITAVTEQHVVAGFAVNFIITAATFDLVVAGRTKGEVVTTIELDVIFAQLTGRDTVGCTVTGDHVVAVAEIGMNAVRIDLQLIFDLVRIGAETDRLRTSGRWVEVTTPKLQNRQELQVGPAAIIQLKELLVANAITTNDQVDIAP